jgi:hypothetical protein
MLCEICLSEMVAVSTVEIPAVAYPEYEIEFPACMETKYVCVCKNVRYLWTKMENDNIN